MTDVELDKALATGDRLVDEQHRAILGLAADLESGPDDRASVIRALDRLADHVLVHFETEEDLMRRSGYPADRTAEHRAEHARCKEAVRAAVIDFHDRRLTSTTPICVMVREWVGDHVGVWDVELVAWSTEQGRGAELPAPRAEGSLGDE